MKRKLLAAAILLFACTNPAAVMPLCACSVAEPLARFDVALRSDADAPLRDRQLRILTASPPCGTFVDLGQRTTRSDSLGIARGAVMGGEEATVCVRFILEAAGPGQPEHTFPDTLRVITRFTAGPPVALTLRLPP